MIGAVDLSSATCSCSFLLNLKFTFCIRQVLILLIFCNSLGQPLSQSFLWSCDPLILKFRPIQGVHDVVSLLTWPITSLLSLVWWSHCHWIMMCSSCMPASNLTKFSEDWQQWQAYQLAHRILDWWHHLRWSSIQHMYLQSAAAVAASMASCTVHCCLLDGLGGPQMPIDHVSKWLAGTEHVDICMHTTRSPLFSPF